MIRQVLIGWLAVVGCLGGPAWAAAQPDRYELGRRLRQFEYAWDETTNDAARKAACGPLNEAVQAFFGLKLGQAGLHIDQAIATLRCHPEIKKPAWAESLCVKLERRLLDRGAAVLAFRLERFYVAGGPTPPGLKLVFELDGRDNAQTHEFVAISELPFEGKLDLGAWPEDADLKVAYRLIVGETVHAKGELGISLAKDLEPRLAKLRETEARLPSDEEVRTADRLTFSHLRQLLTGLAKPSTPETDYPAARLLAEAEALGAALQAKQAFYGKEKLGQHWLALPTGKGRTIVRMQAPAKAAKGEPLPLVIALHGAGGSENMFFDTYGHGMIAKLAAERGWLLVAPRSGLTTNLGELIDALGKLYPVEPRRVFVVGHSMGAGQALAAAVKEPQRFAAIAALGGGRAIRVTEPMKTLPFFVGIGTKDFAYRGAAGLGEALKKGGVKNVDYREYDGLEHLVIVQAALPEVFKFFETQAERSKQSR